MGKQSGEISIRAFATELGVSEGAVRKAVKAGKLGNGVNPATGKIIPELARKTTWAIQQGVVKAKPGVSRVKVAEKITKAGKRGGTVKPVVAREQVVPVSEKYEEEEEAQALLNELGNEEGTSIKDLLNKISVRADMGMEAAVKYQEVVNLASSKMKLQQQAGLLISKDKANQAFYAVGSELKKAIMNVPQRVVRNIQHAPTEVEGISILTAALNEILLEFSNLKQEII
ncbi:hypothetical protein [Parasegetibacter sp. NRK P23]|uniref:hypothetical protein n=1 Tax=Parasegetibacter sp. NRK P23 TaxID=2942999 RepID=UPI002043ADE1|nr:hypothetical protein [Parasegetibacter sp. NRK P23]MCM5528956.1 hypothetical protein [Parasegetibacter sp. NRK P23]